YNLKAVSVTHDDFPLQSVMVVNLSQETFGESGPNDDDETFWSRFTWGDYTGEEDAALELTPGEVRLFQSDIPWEMDRDTAPPLGLPLAAGPRQSARFGDLLCVAGEAAGFINFVGTLFAAGRVIHRITEHPSVPGHFVQDHTLQIGTAGSTWNWTYHFARAYMAPWLGEG